MIAAGTVLRGPDGSYRIDAEHARGGFGITYRGRRERDERGVAVKVLRLDRMGDWKVLDLFEREGRVLRQLSHPGIPAFVDSFSVEDGVAGQVFVLVQELVAGRTLRDLMRSGEVLDQAEMLGWFQDILEVLGYLHGRSPPVVHRDVTPKNIIVRADGRAVLVDFGSVQAVLRTGQSVSSTAAGTFGYAPMEQFVGRAVPATDLYGLGMTFLAVASGREPEGLPMDGVRVNVRAVLLRDARFDSRLAGLLAQMTDPDPRRRPPNAAAALAELAMVRGQVSAPRSTAQTASSSQRVLGAGRAGDPESYLILLASRLAREGFTVHHGGKLGELPLLLRAERARGTLRAADTLHLYVASADQFEGQPGPGERVSAEQLVAFTQAAVIPHAAEGALVSRLVSGRTVVVPVVVSQGGVATALATRAQPAVAAHDGLATVSVVVDLEHGAVHVVPEPKAFGDDREGVLPYVWWLASPRVIERPKGRARRSPLVRVLAGLLAGMVLLAGVGVAYFAATPSGESYLVYVADPDGRRIAVKRFFVKKALLGTDLVSATPGQRALRTASVPANAYPCALSGNRVSYFVQERAANSVAYWTMGLDGRARREVGRTPYSSWWWCALLGDRVAFATGDAKQEGVIMIQQAAAVAAPANGTVAGDKFPAWFPDGNGLVVSAGPAGRERLLRIDLKTGERTRLTGEPDSWRGAEIRPSVSADGRRVAYYRGGRRALNDGMRRPSSDVFDLYVLELGKGQPRLVVQEVCFAAPAAWLSDDELVYGRWSNGECAVFLYDLKSEVSTGLAVDY